jgi:hypothetical protein
MASASKATVTLNGIPLAGTTPVVWQFTAGTAPYSTTVTFGKSFEGQIKQLIGKPLILKIVDSRGVSMQIKEVYVLHKAVTDAPSRVSYVISDRRWKWRYKLVSRDYNVIRKTGTRSRVDVNLPVETAVTVDQFDYHAYSIQEDGTRYSAKEALQDVLDVIEEGSYDFESFPFDSEAEKGAITLQNVTLRDSGDVAVARILSYIPGADIYVNADGRVVIYDTTDRKALKDYFGSLPITTRSGDYATWIDRKHIRPATVQVHYQREVEVLFHYQDDYSGTTGGKNPDSPFLENVLPTVDPETTVNIYDPESGTTKRTKVAPGTWVEVSEWLAAMDADRPENSQPWTFDTLRMGWVAGDLEGLLGAGGREIDTEANIALRVAALRQHFRQTFRINRRYMDRIRSLRAVRVAQLDPVTGARAPAAVWGQACEIPSSKSFFRTRRGPVGSDGSAIYRNVDYIAPSRQTGRKIVDTPPGPTAVQILDEDLGIFRLQWIDDPYGLTKAWYPCNLVGSSNQAASPIHDLELQDTDPICVNAMVESGANGLFLDRTTEFYVLVTIVPAAPNNNLQFHRVPVAAERIAELFGEDLNIVDGKGPEMEVYVPPGELTARFAWDESEAAEATVRQLLGLSSGGVAGPELPGFVLVNNGEGQQRHIEAHSEALSAEVLVAFNDALQGTVSSVVPQSGIELKGNTRAAGIRVGTYPSAKVEAVHVFPGQAAPSSRFALLPNTVRQQVLGTLVYSE